MILLDFFVYFTVRYISDYVRTLHSLLSIIDNYKFRTSSFIDYVVTDDNRTPIETRLKIKYFIKIMLIYLPK